MKEREAKRQILEEKEKLQKVTIHHKSIYL